MELILWRHAEAEDGAPDRDRALTAKGLKQARRMAKWLEAKLPGNIVTLVSPAKRTRQTARALTEDFRIIEAVSTSGSAESLLSAIGWPGSDQNALIVGHQPTLGETVALLLSGRKEQWGMKKGAVIWLSWRERDGASHVQLRAAVSPDLI